MGFKCDLCYCCARFCSSLCIVLTCAIGMMALRYFIWLFELAYCGARGTTCEENPVRTESLWTFIAGVAAFIASMISISTILSHLYHNKVERMKWCIIRILLLVPVYAVDAYLCLIFEPSKYQWPVLLNVVREIYEAVVLISFIQFVVAFLGETNSSGRDLTVSVAKKLADESVEHVSVLSHVLPAMAPGADFVAQNLFGILQYAFVMVGCMFVDFGVWLWKLEDESASSNPILGLLESAPTWIMCISNTIAMYYLILLYHETLHAKETHDDMHTIQPYNKFFCIKGIVMLTFWQTLLIHLSVSSGLMAGCVKEECGPGEWSKEQMGAGFMNFVLCIEMLGFAEWHKWAYPVDETGCLEKLFEKLCCFEPERNEIPSLGAAALGFLEKPDRFLDWHDMLQQIWTLQQYTKRQYDAMAKAAERPEDRSAPDEAFRALTLDGAASHVAPAQLRFFLVRVQGRRAVEVEEAIKGFEKNGKTRLTEREFASLMQSLGRQTNAPALERPLL